MNTRRRKANLLRYAKQRANEKNLPYNIDEEDIYIPSHCPLLGIPLGTTFDGTPTLDRIIPRYGYTKGNVLVISARANRIKSNASIHEILTVAESYKRIIQERFRDEDS